MADLPDFEVRYAPNWPDISRLARRLTGDRCILCGDGATETHHALYGDDQGAIAGREIPGVHVFPLCANCHQGDGGAHAPINWYRDMGDPVRGNHQAPAYYRKLRAGWVGMVYGDRGL